MPFVKSLIISRTFCETFNIFFLNLLIIPRINIMGYNCAHNRVGLFIFYQLHIAILPSRKGSDRRLKPGFKDINVQTDYSIVLVQNKLANFCSFTNQYSWVWSSGWRSTTCALVIFRVEVSCIRSVDGNILWLSPWLFNYVSMLLVVCQLSRDVIGYEDS